MPHKKEFCTHTESVLSVVDQPAHTNSRSIENNYIQIKKEGYWCDKGSVHSYIDSYCSIGLASKPIKSILEIGVFDGGSLLLWKRTFPTAQIVGFDNRTWTNFDHNKFNKLLSSNNIEFIEGNITLDKDREKLKNYRFDLIIDDADHTLDSQLIAVQTLTPLLNKGGLFIVEDIKSTENSVEVQKALSAINKGNLYVIDRRIEKKRYDDILIIWEKLYD